MPMPLELGQLTQQDYNLLQSRLNQFEDAWENSSARTVNLAEYLPPHGHPQRPLYLRELVKSDMEARWRHKQAVGLEYYLEKFPELGDRRTVDVNLIVEEYRIRQQHGDKPRQETYKKRFANQFEDFQRLLQIAPGTASNLEKTLAPQPGDAPAAAAAPPSKARSEMGNSSYKFIRRLGSGAFAEVWLAEAPGGVQVAVKRLIHVMEKDAAQRELEALERTKNLRHAYLLEVYAFWLDQDRLHIAMSLADCTLRDRMRECQVQGAKGIPRDELILYFRESAEGLDYLHKQRLVHRDIKPENILLRTGHIKIADFGLARALHSARMSASNAAGTLLYMAPEVWNKKIGQGSDQYSLALSYAELAQGRHPFEAQAKTGGFYGVMVAHQKEEPDLADLPEADRKVLLKALSKDPEQRFPSCKAFIDALCPLSRPVATPVKQPQGLPLGLGYQLLIPVGNALRNMSMTLKALAPDGRPALVTRFNLERQSLTKRDLDAYTLLARMDHPNLLPLQAAWVLSEDGQVVWAVKRKGDVSVSKDLPASALTGGTLNLATDLMGESLARRMEQHQDGRRDLSPGDALDYLKQAASVVDFLNARTHPLGNRNVAFRHCGVTPENLLITEQGVMLGDYSLIQMVDGPAAELPTTVSGFSATYAAPELFQNRIYDTSDQYSLAVIHYQLSTGTLPFSASLNSQDRINMHKEGRLDFSRLRDNERKAISGGASVDPGMRFLSCSALVKAICEARMLDTPTGTLEPGVVEELLGPGRLAAAAAPGLDSPSDVQDILRGRTIEPDTTFDEEVLSWPSAEHQLPKPTTPPPSEPALDLTPVSLSEVTLDPPTPPPPPVESVEPRQPKPKTQQVAKLRQTQLVPHLKTEASIPLEVRQTQIPPDSAVRQSWHPKPAPAKPTAPKEKKSARGVLIAVAALLVAGVAFGGFMVLRPPGADKDSQLDTAGGNPREGGTKPPTGGQGGGGGTTSPNTEKPETTAKARPIATKTVEPPKTGDARWKELDKKYSALHEQLKDKTRLSDVLVNLEKLLTECSPYTDLVLSATLDRDRAAVGTGQWSKIKGDLDYLGAYKEVAAYWPYLDLMVRLNTERSSLESQPSAVNEAIQHAVEVRGSSLYDGSKLEAWEKDQFEHETAAAADVGMRLLRTAPVDAGLVALSETLPSFDPKKYASIKDSHTELSALLLAASTEKKPEIRPQAITDLREVLRGGQELVRPGEVVRVYATLCQSGEDQRTIAIGVLENAFRNKHPARNEESTKYYELLLAEEVKARYPKAQVDAEFQALRDYCDKFESKDLVGLPLACKAEALAVQGDVAGAQDLLEKGKDLPQVGPDGKYAEFVRGRVQTAASDFGHAVPFFDISLKPDTEPLLWQNPARCQAGARAYYELGKSAKAIPDKLPRLQRAVVLLESSKSDVPALYRFALADTAFQANPMNAAIAREQANQLLNNHPNFVKQADKAYAVRRIRASAQASLGDFEGAVKDYQVLVDSWSPEQKKAGDFYKEVLDPALQATRGWKAQNKDNVKCLSEAAGLLASGGHFVWKNRFEDDLPGTEEEHLTLSMKDFEEAADTYPALDARKAEYRTWHAYLLTQVKTMDASGIETLKKLGSQAKQYSREYSGSYFLDGLALTYEALLHLDNAARGLDLEKKAVTALEQAITVGKKENAPLLEYYYLTNSTAHLLLGNYLYTQCPAKVEEYRKELQEAQINARASIRDDENAWFAHLQLALALEDLAWIGIDPEQSADRTKAFKDSIQEYERSDKLRPRFSQTLVGKGRTYYRWITLLSADRTKLKDAEKALRDALATTRPKKGDDYYRGEALIWLVRVYLEMAREPARSADESDQTRARADLTTAVKFQTDAIGTIPESLWGELYVNLAMEIGLATTSGTDKELAIFTLNKVRDQCAEVRKKGETIARKDPKKGNLLVVQSYYYDVNASLWLGDRMRSKDEEEGVKLLRKVPRMCDILVEHQDDWGKAAPTEMVSTLALGNSALVVFLGGGNVRKEDAAQNIRQCLAAVKVADSNKLHPAIQAQTYGRLALARDYHDDLSPEERRQIIKDAKEALRLDKEACKQDPTGCQLTRKPDPDGAKWNFLVARCSWELWNSGSDDTKRKDAKLWEEANTHARRVGGYPLASAAIKKAAKEIIKDLGDDKPDEE